MKLFDNFFQKNNENELPGTGENQHADHSVIIEFTYGLDSMDELYQLEDDLEAILKETGAGEYDGHEIAIDLSDGFLFLYGSNAETVFKTVKPALENCSFIKGAIARLTFGPLGKGAREIEVPL